MITWKDIYAKKPEWFAELFEWLKDRDYNTYLAVRYDIVHHILPIGTCAIRIARCYLLIYLIDWDETAKGYDWYESLDYAYNRHICNAGINEELVL